MIENPIFVNLQQKNVVAQEISSYVRYHPILTNKPHDGLVCFLYMSETPPNSWNLSFFHEGGEGSTKKQLVTPMSVETM